MTIPPALKSKIEQHTEQYLEANGVDTAAQRVGRRLLYFQLRRHMLGMLDVVWRILTDEEPPKREGNGHE